MKKQKHWSLTKGGSSISEAVRILREEGGAVVTPTNVGYIIMTTDGKGLERKFELKERSKSKPGVVLLSDLGQLKALAQTTPKIDQLYSKCWEENKLLGCILPWRSESIRNHVPDDGSRGLVMDGRQTSCFVIKYGLPSEQVATRLWEDHGLLSFASSANLSGKGNSGKVAGIGDQITDQVDLVVEADPWVARRQPGKNAETRFAQGVMVSMVTETGALDDNCPVLIRRGLYVDEIMSVLSSIWSSWNYRHGAYH